MGNDRKAAGRRPDKNRRQWPAKAAGKETLAPRQKPGQKQRQECTPASLAQVFSSINCPCPEGALAGLASYINMLMRWNRVMNLVGSRTWQDAAKDLVADCLHLAVFLETLNLPDNPLTWDPGAGAGLPGIPLRLVWQKGSYHMVEIRQKRALFLSQALGTLSLQKTYAHNMDINAFMGSEKADLVISRAFMPWDKVLALFSDHLADNGQIVFMASRMPDADDFAAHASSCRLAAEHAYQSGSTSRCFFAVQKEARI